MACDMGLSVSSARNHIPGNTTLQEHSRTDHMSQACLGKHDRGLGIGVGALEKQNLSLDLGVACVLCVCGGDSQNKDKNLPERGSR